MKLNDVSDSPHKCHGIRFGFAALIQDMNLVLDFIAKSENYVAQCNESANETCTKLAHTKSC